MSRRKYNPSFRVFTPQNRRHTSRLGVDADAAEIELLLHEAEEMATVEPQSAKERVRQEIAAAKAAGMYPEPVQQPPQQGPDRREVYPRGEEREDNPWSSEAVATRAPEPEPGAARKVLLSAHDEEI